jgi:NADPH:quinone reductase-like Zn-dependent oxidoreductase
VDLVRGLGADAVYDYAKGEFPPVGEPFDLVLDIASTRPWSDFKRVMKPDALMVIVGGPGSKTFWGPLRRIAHLKLFSWRASQKTPFFVAQFKREDFDTLAAMLASGKIRSVIDSVYPFSQLPAAMEKLGEAHAQGKIVVTVE